MSELVPASGAASGKGGPRRHDAFGASGSGDTSGFGGLVRNPPILASTSRPFGDTDADNLYDALERSFPQLTDALERVVVDRGELTLHVRRDHLLSVAQILRDDPSLRFELLSGVSGADYPDDPTGRRLHAVYHLMSMTWRRRIRVEVSLADDDPVVPSVMDVWPTADWHERETYDLFGIVFSGRDGLLRIMMPDDWVGHPQRKDYPLGGVPVDYKGAQVPAPDTRRSYS
ncbi:NADH-quinone oxidoreductase subunit C [Protofrankia symbiont of Coriaria ruscifolia]|uniref:NADH-quinone oxidoreductase subunit C n=1 Tax=Protofrankia symbiont of Coriaria ruscifolia TaxID=1306542 RepID=UPI0010411F77|nr:NADH-quinone oxidoreductase subunit C [Protofrankia symbiont of Coriaria ruscifolia]